MDHDRQNPAFYALLVALIFMAVGPIVLMFTNSFKLDVDIIGGTSGLLFLPTIQNYETALCDVLWYEPEHLDFCALKFGGAFVNSLIIALVSTALTLIIGCMAAYALVRFRFMGRDTASLTTLMVRMVPPAVLLVPVFGLWNNEFCISKKFWLGELIRDTFGGRGDICLAGTHSGIILIYVAMNLPFVIWILQSFIVQVPRSLEEAALDGVPLRKHAHTFFPEAKRPFPSASTPRPPGLLGSEGFWLHGVRMEARAGRVRPPHADLRRHGAPARACNAGGA